MYQKTTLSNGLRIVSSTMPHTRSVCVGVFIGTGSRYEKAEEAGISHFIEHLCFKGTQRRATSKEISEAIEGVGGMLNGGTDKELTLYWCKVARPHFPLAVDVLADMLSHSRFDPGDIEKERQVITEEINMALDSPQYQVDLLIDELMWSNQPLGRDVAGTKATVAALTHQNILDYLAQHYLANNVVVSIAGDITHGEVVNSLEEVFRCWHEGVPQAYCPAEIEQYHPKLRVGQRDTKEAHLCLAVPGLSLNHPDRFTLDLLSVILGEGMSSRLFLEIREKRGLAYAIHSYADHFLDTGSLTVYAGIDPQRLSIAIEAILTELNRLKEGIPELELSKAKELCKGRLLLRMEDTRSVAGWLGGQELLLGDILSVDQVVSIIDSIQADDLLRVAREIVVGEKLNLAVVGPVEDKNLEGLLQL
ncbi:MAG TPA: pitrilysin family protein [Dehalococcoidia bacterium]|nr:pitrilysin family protein [Dehalococcoidia bacterium]